MSRNREQIRIRRNEENIDKYAFEVYSSKQVKHLQISEKSINEQNKLVSVGKKKEN